MAFFAFQNPCNVLEQFDAVRMGQSTFSVFGAENALIKYLGVRAQIACYYSTAPRLEGTSLKTGDSFVVARG